MKIFLHIFYRILSREILRNQEVFEPLNIDGFLKGTLVITNTPLSPTAQGPNINYLGNKPPKQ